MALSAQDRRVRNVQTAIVVQRICPSYVGPSRAQAERRLSIPKSRVQRSYR